MVTNKKTSRPDRITDLVSGLVQSVKKNKYEFLNGVREEVSKYLEKVDPKKLLEEVLQNYDVEVKAKISFAPKKKTVRKKKKS